MTNCLKETAALSLKSPPLAKLTAPNRSTDLKLAQAEVRLRARRVPFAEFPPDVRSFVWLALQQRRPNESDFASLVTSACKCYQRDGKFTRIFAMAKLQPKQPRPLPPTQPKPSEEPKPPPRRRSEKPPDTQQTLPHSDEAEQGLLGSMLQPHGGKEAIAEAITKLDAQYFYVPAHKTIFTLITDLYEGGKPVELITLTQELRDRNLLNSVGGPAFVTGLFTFVPTAANVAYYIKIVREKYLLREALATCTETARRLIEPGADDEGNPDTILDAHESRIASLRSRHGSNGQFTMRSPSEILGLPRDPHANFFADRMLAKAQTMLMAGIGDLGKSRLLEQLLASLIIGRPWCGLETHAKEIKCVVFQAENPNARLQDDLEALKRWAGKDWKLIDENLLIHCLESDDDLLVHLSDPINARRMESVVRRENPGIVAFDPIANFGIGDLNTDLDMAATIREMSRIARKGNAERALIMLHHALTGREGLKKAFGFERSGFARNSKVVFNLPRGVINVVPGTEDYSVLIIFCGKNNNGKPFAPVAIRLNPDTMIYEVEPDFDIEEWKAQISTGKGNTAVARKQTWREALQRDREYDLKELVELVKEAFVVKQSQAYDLIRKAKGKELRYNKTIKTYALA